LLNLRRKAFGKVYIFDAVHFVMGAFLGMIWCFARVLVKTPPCRKRLLGICFWREGLEAVLGPERMGEKGGWIHVLASLFTSSPSKHCK